MAVRPTIAHTERNVQPSSGYIKTLLEPRGVNREERCRRNVQPTCHPGAGYYLPWVQQISRWSVDIPPNSSSRKTQHAIYLLERLCLSLNRKRAAPDAHPGDDPQELGRQPHREGC